MPGITHDNVRGTVGEILKNPEEVREEDGYTVVVGENPQGEGELTLWIYDGFVMKGTTEEMEQSEEAEQDQGDTGEDAQQQEDESGDSSGPSPRRILPEIARLIPDGGESKEHEAMNELRQKGVPSETIVDWSNQGYDVQAMNKALDQYQNSGETFSTDRRTARGEFGEILAKQEVTNRYPRSTGYEYEQNVKLDKGGSKGEIDWVVIDNNTGNVVATYQVKSGSSVERVRDAQKQKQLVKNNFKEGEINQMVNTSGLTVGDFTDDGNLDEIDRYTLGPQDGTSSNRRPGNSYDETYDLTEDEFEAVLDMIRENGI